MAITVVGESDLVESNGLLIAGIVESVESPNPFVLSSLGTVTVPVGTAVVLTEPGLPMDLRAASDVVVVNSDHFLVLASDDEAGNLPSGTPPINNNLVSFLVETGGFQDVSSAFGLSAGTVEIQSDPVPLPAALPLFATGLAGLGLLGWRRKKKAAA
jgi:hypothetical protein